MNNFEKETKDRDEVLVGNNAQTIYQHIRDLENDIAKQGRRWFWELLQNAKDVKKNNEEIEIVTEYTDNRLTFKHSGKEFKGKYVGIEDLGNGIWKVFYRNVFLGFFNENNIRDKQVSIRLSHNMV